MRTRGELNTPEEFGAIIVSQGAGGIVRLRDVADVEVGAEDERTVARYNGRPAVGLGIVKQSKASTLDVARAVNESLGSLRAALPAGMELSVAYDSAEFIRDSIGEVGETLLIAMCLVILVVIAFLKSVRATIIPTLAIPVSIIGTFVVIYFMGFTINILTLLALVLAIGLVVDDAIVVLENIFRHMEMGKSRMQAAFDGSKEIGFAVLATTITLVAVFVPVAFLTGSVGRLFHEFGFSVAIAVAISGFVALTLTPMFCSRMSEADSRHRTWVGGALLRRVLRLAEPHLRTLAAVCAAAPAAGDPGGGRGGDSQRGCVHVHAARTGADRGPRRRLRDRDRARRIDAGLHRPLHAAGGGAAARPAGAEGPLFRHWAWLWRAGPRDQRLSSFSISAARARQRSQQEIVQSLFPQLFAIPGVLAFVINPPSLGSFASSPIEYVLQAESYDELNQAVGIMMGEASKLGYLFNLDTDLKLNKPQLNIAIDRDRASQLGVSVTDIGSTLETLLGGRVVSNFKRGTKQYDVIIQVPAEHRATPSMIQDIYVRGDRGWCSWPTSSS